MKTWAMLAAILSLGLLAGCDKVEEAAKAQVAEVVFKGCSDPSTIDTLKSIFDDQFSAAASVNPENKAFLEDLRSKSDLQLQAIRTDSINKDVGKHDCRALMRLVVPEANRALLSPNYSHSVPETAAVLTETGLEIAVAYTAQMTDDGQNVYVEVAQPFDMASRLVSNAAVWLSFEEIRKESESSAKASEQARPRLSAEDCISAKAAEFRLENGENASVSEDLAYSWKQTCFGGE